MRLLVLGAALGLAATPARGEAPQPAAERILSSIESDSLRHLILEVLERSPEIAAHAAQARAAQQRPRQLEALPDPTLGFTAFASQPETRVGPQQVMLSVSERFPWFGKLDLRGETASHEADAVLARVESVRLRSVTETRRLYYELAFLEVFEQVVREDRTTLVHYEELARARYASGVGLEQSVVKIQAEITKADTRLLDIDSRRAALRAQLNALRDRPDGTPIPMPALPRYAELGRDLQGLRQQAIAARPEIAEAEALISRSRTGIRLARKDYKPDFMLGLSYTFVGGRSDAPGRANPPEDDGKDILGLSAGVSVPLWRGKLAAGVEEAAERLRGSEETRRAVAAGIDQALGDLVHRIPLTWDRLRLFEDVLLIQAGQSLRSAEAGYAAGTLNALDLLDAERVLLEVRVAAARALADYAIAAAQLEGTVGTPVFTAEEQR